MVQAMENGHASTDQQAMPAPGAIVPAGPVKNVVPSPNLAAVKVDTQTRAIGLIQPPPDIRAIVDKTAQFVAKNGMQALSTSHVQGLRTLMHVSLTRHPIRGQNFGKRERQPQVQLLAHC